jgi:hypothetical protein
MQKDWITENYSNIIQWSRNICKNDALYEELAHYAIEKLLTHKRYEEILDKHNKDPKYGHFRGFILAIMRNSWFGKKSEFRRVNANHRADIGSRKRVVSDHKWQAITEDQPDEEYDFDTDFLVEAIEGLIEEMDLELESGLWYRSRLLKMWLETPNFSELSRMTDIPRTSISKAVEEAKAYIIEELKNRNII